SVCVHAFPSLHGVPLLLAGLEQIPVAGLQTPGSWQGSGLGHTTGFEPVHTPPLHASVFVHALPSLHALPVNSLHVPFVSAPAFTEHASHGPALHAVSQQTPSTQKPLRQSAVETH